MFSKKSSHESARKLPLWINKMLDPKREMMYKFVYLKKVLEALDPSEHKDFFNSYSLELFIIFYEEFMHFENSLKARGGLKSCLEYFIFLYNFIKKILLFLPHLVKKRWQYNAIYHIIRKMVNSNGYPKIRCYGIELYITWLQCIQDPKDIFSVSLFPAIVCEMSPELSDYILKVNPDIFPKDKGLSCAIMCCRTIYSSIFSQTSIEDDPSKLIWAECNSCSPVPLSERSLINSLHLSFIYFNKLIEYLTYNLLKIHWENKKMTEKSFHMTFDIVYKYLISTFFPTINSPANIFYSKEDSLENFLVKNSNEDHDANSAIQNYKSSLIYWIVTFISKPSNLFKPESAVSTSVDLRLGSFISTESSQVVSSTPPATLTVASYELRASNENISPENEATLQGVAAEVNLPSKASLKETYNKELNDIVQTVFFSSTNHISCIFELFRVSFLSPHCSVEFCKKVLNIFYNWTKVSKPIFVDYSENFDPERYYQDLNDGLSDKIPSQKFYRIIFYISLSAFFSDSSFSPNYSIMIPKFNRCLRFIRILVTRLNDFFTDETWAKIVDGMLDLFRHVFNNTPPNIIYAFNVSPTGDIDTFLTYFCQTIFVTFIRANMASIIPSYLWDKFSNSLSNSFFCPHVFNEWKYMCEVATWSYCYSHYNLDFYNLPLNRVFDSRRKFRHLLKKNGESRAKDNSFINIISSKGIKKKFRTIKVVPSKDALETVQFIEDTADISEHGSQNNIKSGEEESGLTLSEQQQEIVSVSSQKGDAKSIKNMKFVSSFDKSSENTSPKEREGIISLPFNDYGSVSDVSSPKTEAELFQIPKISFPSYSSLDELNYSSKKEADFWYSQETSKSLVPINIDEESKKDEFDETKADDIPLKEELSLLNISCEDKVEIDDLNEKENFSEIKKFGFTSHISKVEVKDKDFSTVILTRSLGLFGNINNLKPPSSRAFSYKIFFEMLEKIEDVTRNIGITEDFKYVPPTEIVNPPLSMFIPVAVECLLNFEETYIESYIEAEKLLIRSILSPVHLLPLSNEYIILFIGTLKHVLENSSPICHNIVLKYCSTLFLSDIPGIFMLLKSILNTIEKHIQFDDITSPFVESSYIFLSLGPNFFHFPTIPIISQKNNEMQGEPLIDLFPRFLKLVIRYSTSVPNMTARANSLRTLFLLSLEFIENKQSADLIILIISIIVRHLYSKSMELVSIACSLLNTYLEYLDKINEIIPDIPFTIFNETCIAIKSLAKFEHTSIPLKIQAYNVGMMILDFLTDFIMTVKPLQPRFVDIYYVTMNEIYKFSSNLKQVDVTSSPSLYFRDFLSPYVSNIDQLCFEYFSNMKDVTIVNSEDCISDFNDSDAKEEGFELTNPATNPKERENSFRIKVKQIATFCLTLLNNYPFILGPECISSIIYEGDLFEDNNEAIRNCLAACINDEAIVVFLEISDTFKTELLCRSKITNKKFLMSSTFILLNIRTGLGKFTWIISEIVCQDGEKHTPIPNELMAELSSPDKKEVNLGSTDVVSSFLLLTSTDFPESKNFYNFSDRHTSISNFYEVSNFFKSSELTVKSSQDFYKSNGTLFYNFCDLLVSQKIRPKYSECERMRLFRVTSLLSSQLCLFTNESRSSVTLMNPSERFFRDARQLDLRLPRSSHKVAVFYIKPGQEDKESILSNHTTSSEFSAFISGLGWKIDLGAHKGFSGGLDKSYSSGFTATYYSNPINEVIYHVSPHMPLSDDVNGMITKLRHLGNDEIHVIWSEHYRPFRRGIINTEFGDVLIVIYPMKSSLYKINILKRPHIPQFGPLCDGSVVSFHLLPVLIRETVINASLSIRMSHSLFTTTFEDRLNVIRQLKEKHRVNQTFEDFVSTFLSKDSEKYEL